MSEAFVQAHADILQSYAGFVQAAAGFAGAFAVVWAANLASKTFGASLERKKAEAAYDIPRRAIEFAAQTGAVYASIRNPAVYRGEGESRKKELGETPEQTEKLNRIFIIRERINSHEEFWNTGIRLQWELSAVFGSEFAYAVREIVSKRTAIAFAWDRIYDGDDIYPVDDATKAALRKARETIWDPYTPNDSFKAGLQEQQEILINGLKQYVRVGNRDENIEPSKKVRPWWNQPRR